MKTNSRQEWKEYALEIAKYGLSNGGCSPEELLIMYADSYINELELKIANYSDKLDKFYTITLSKQNKDDLINNQLAKESFDE